MNCNGDDMSSMINYNNKKRPHSDIDSSQEDEEAAACNKRPAVVVSASTIRQLRRRLGMIDLFTHICLQLSNHTVACSGSDADDDAAIAPPSPSSDCCPSATLPSTLSTAQASACLPSPPLSPVNMSSSHVNKNMAAHPQSQTQTVSGIQRLMTHAMRFPFPYINTAASASTSSNPGNNASPHLVLMALLLLRRIAGRSSHTTTPALPRILHDPLALLLGCLMVAEAHLADSQTSTASWSRLLLGASAGCAFDRAHVVACKAAVLECLGWETLAPKREYVAWVSHIRGYLNGVMSIQQQQQQQSMA